MKNEKRNKLEIGKLGDVHAALTRWKSAVEKGPDIMSKGGLITYGAIVFACMHLFEGKQTVSMHHFTDDCIEPSWPKKMQSIVMDRHVCLFAASSFDNTISFQIYFVFNKEQTSIESIICADLTILGMYFLDNPDPIFSIVQKFIGLDDDEMKIVHQKLKDYVW